MKMTLTLMLLALSSITSGQSTGDALTPPVNIPSTAIGTSAVNITTQPGSNPMEFHTTQAVGLNVFAHSGTFFRAPNMFLYRSRGTQTAPTAVQSGDALGYYQFGGYDGLNYIQLSSIQVSATQNYSVGANGSDFLINVVPNNTAVQTPGLYIANSTGVSVGSINDPGAGQLSVTGLKTTGSASGKVVVCVDTATGKLYASSSSSTRTN